MTKYTKNLALFFFNIFLTKITRVAHFTQNFDNYQECNFLLFNAKSDFFISLITYEMHAIHNIPDFFFFFFKKKELEYCVPTVHTILTAVFGT